jgi:RNA recognition motif. (a.k.a. RRM, RBD, or RNP domain)
VKADINEDRATGRSRGFGTVLFETGEQATAAIEVHPPSCGAQQFASRFSVWTGSSKVGFCLCRQLRAFAAMKRCAGVHKPGAWILDTVSCCLTSLATVVNPGLLVWCRRSVATTSMAGL